MVQCVVSLWSWWMFAIVVLDLVSSVQDQEIGWENVSKMTYFVSSES